MRIENNYADYLRRIQEHFVLLKPNLRLQAQRRVLLVPKGDDGGGVEKEKAASDSRS